MSRRLQLVLLAIAVVGALISIGPFLVMIATSFDTFTYVLPDPPRLIPEQPTVDNFVQAWTSNSFGRYFLNSLYVASVTTILTVLVSSLTAFAFARLKWPGRDKLFGLLLFTMMVPGMVSLLPQFTVTRSLGLIDRYAGLYLVYTSGSVAFYTFLLRGFFQQIPRELEEAVLIDGGSHWTFYWRVAMPLVRPGLATVAIFAFLGSWDEFFWALTVIKDVDKRTLPIAIALFQGQHGTRWGLVFAASLIAVTPVIALFVAFQRHFIQGLTQGATKG